VYSSAYFDLGTRWRWMVRFTSQSLQPLGHRVLYQVNRRLCGYQSWSGRFGQEEYSFSLLGIELRSLSRSTDRQDTILITLFLLFCRKCRGILRYRRFAVSRMFKLHFGPALILVFN
jgi:hypothetical protein